MKILLQINTVVNYGSTGLIAEEIGQTAILQGWESYIAFGRNERPSQSNLLKIGSDLDIQVHGIQTRLFDRHGLASSGATRKLIEKIKEIKPDLIHLHNLHGYYLNIKVLFNYLSKADIPVVWTFHDCWPMTGHCTHFTSVHCEKWKELCFRCPQKQSYPASYFLDRSEKNYVLKKELFTSVKNLTIVPVSQWLGGLVAQSFLRGYPRQVINNGIDTEVFRPTANSNLREKYKIKEPFIILGVANIWSPRKGLADFIALSKLIDPDTRIILVGLSARQIGTIPANILGISRTESKQELAELYSLADVYVNPSVEETFGLTTAEALSCGTPAIVYNATASPEVVSSDTGFIVGKRNIVGLFEAIDIVKKHGKALYAGKCRDRAIRLYDKNEQNLDYLNLYTAMIERQSD